MDQIIESSGQTLGVGRPARRVAGGLMVADGLFAAALGRSYVRWWEFGPEEHPYRRVVSWLAARPDWLIRAVGLVEAGVGVSLMGTAPLSTTELYRAASGIYDQINAVWRTRFYTDGHRAFHKAMATHLAPDGDVLDLACGTAANLEQLDRMDVPFGTYTGVDLSEAMLDRAHAKMADREGVHFAQLDLEADPLPEGPFDLIVSSWALEHLEDPGAVVEKAWEHLRSGGYMLLFFEIATPYWWGQLVGRVLRFLSAEKVPERVYLDFPGLIAVNRYRGAFGDVALVTLRKP